MLMVIWYNAFLIPFRAAFMEQHEVVASLYTLFDYALDIAPGVAVYADPSQHSPAFCGHMINDPRGTPADANAVECPIGGGALIGILTLRDIAKGEELLMDYGERYWQARSQTGVKTKSRDCAGDV